MDVPLIRFTPMLTSAIWRKMVVLGTGHGDLVKRCLVKKREDTAGGVLSGGSFLGRGKVLGVW